MVPLTWLYQRGWQSDSFDEAGTQTLYALIAQMKRFIKQFPAIPLKLNAILTMIMALMIMPQIMIM